jgi:hypothetical protein
MWSYHYRYHHRYRHRFTTVEAVPPATVSIPTRGTRANNNPTISMGARPGPGPGPGPGPWTWLRTGLTGLRSRLLLCLCCLSLLGISCCACTSSPYQPLPSPQSVTDVFFVISGLKNYEFVDDGHFWVGLQALKLLSRRHSDSGFDSRIHIISENPVILSKVNSFGPPFYSHDMNQMQFITLPFFEIYKRVHDSVNSLEYEFLCFNRWLLMRHIVSSSKLNISRVLSLDLDVLMLFNANEFVDRVMHALQYQATDDFDVIVIGLGAVNIFSINGLNIFSDYIYSYFNRSVEIVSKAVQSYVHFFSDMMIMKEFLLDSKVSKPVRKNSYFEYWKADEYYTHWRANESNGCLLQRLGCVPMSGYREMLTTDNSLSVQIQVDEAKFDPGKISSPHSPNKLSRIYLQGTREELPYCLMVGMEQSYHCDKVSLVIFYHSIFKAAKSNHTFALLDI